MSPQDSRWRLASHFLPPDYYSVQQLTCLACPIREEGVHDELLGRRAYVRQVPPPPADDRLGVRLPEVAQDPLLGLVLARDPDSAQHLAGRPREEALDQVRPGAVPGRGHELEAAQDGGQAAPRLGGGARRDVAGHDPHQVALRVLAVQDPEELDVVGALVRLAREGGRLSGRQVDRGEERQGAEPPVLVVAPDRAPVGPQVGGGVRARPGCPASRRGTARGPPGPPPRG